MKVHSKKLLSVLLAMMMALGLMAPALATEGTSVTKDTKIQITKDLLIGKGVTVPDTTFTFKFRKPTEPEATALKNDDPLFHNFYLPQEAVNYPELADVTVAYGGANLNRDADGTDEVLTNVTAAVDLNETSWGSAGHYVYYASEVNGGLDGMTYDAQEYRIKVYVINGTNGPVVDNVTVEKFDSNTSTWSKIDGTPNANKESAADGCEDYVGNNFKFTNAYNKIVEKHPINNNPTSGDTPLDGDTDYSQYAFKLTKDVSGASASQTYAFTYHVTVKLPASYQGNDYTLIPVLVNGYSAQQINQQSSVSTDGIDPTSNDPTPAQMKPGVEYMIHLKHGDSFVVNALPVGSEITVSEQGEQGYIPAYSGKWGQLITTAKTGSKAQGESLAVDGTIVVGEHGAYIQYTNTVKDISPTGIVISNLPYILMVGISLAGIGFFTLSKKRRNS